MVQSMCSKGHYYIRNAHIGNMMFPICISFETDNTEINLDFPRKNEKVKSVGHLLSH